MTHSYNAAAGMNLTPRPSDQPAHGPGTPTTPTDADPWHAVLMSDLRTCGLTAKQAGPGLAQYLESLVTTPHPREDAVLTRLADCAFAQPTQWAATLEICANMPPQPAAAAARSAHARHAGHHLGTRVQVGRAHCRIHRARPRPRPHLCNAGS